MAESKKGFPKGTSGNPGGLTKHQAANRAAQRAWLHSEPVSEAWKAALLTKLKKGDNDIVKWVGDQIVGKATQAIELADVGERPLLGVGADLILAAPCARCAMTTRLNSAQASCWATTRR